MLSDDAERDKMEREAEEISKFAEYERRAIGVSLRRDYVQD
jgi:hypothetical protein